jgi:hypothetical protein
MYAVGPAGMQDSRIWAASVLNRKRVGSRAERTDTRATSAALGREPISGSFRREDPPPLLADLDCAVRGSGPVAPRLPWALSSWSVHRAVEACAMDQCPGARDLRPGSACCLPADVAGQRGARGAAAACRGERAGCRASRGRPGSPGRAGVSLPGVVPAGSALRDPHLAARSCRGEQDLTGPPRGRGEDDLGGGRSRTSACSNPAVLSPAWRPARRSRSGTTAPGAPLDGSVITGYPATVTAQRVRVRSR